MIALQAILSSPLLARSYTRRFNPFTKLHKDISVLGASNATVVVQITLESQSVESVDALTMLGPDVRCLGPRIVQL